LAIELAAARLHMMSPSQLLERLDDEFELLTDGSSQAVAHHRAMEATLDWSYQLLGPPEQMLFRRLSVFRGGFTLEIIERFHATFPPVDGNALQLLGRLVDASMVARAPEDRLKMLEPIRHYGLLLLQEHGELADARVNHSLVYREMFRVPDTNLFGPAPGSRWNEPFMAEMDNVRAALNWADESDDIATTVELGAVAICLFGAVGYLAEAYHWLTRVLSVTSEATPHRARALARGSFIAGIFDGPERAESLVDELEAVAETLDDDAWRAATVERRAMLALHRLEFDTASRLWRDAASRLLELDNPSSFLALSNYMECLSHAGRYEAAQEVGEQLAQVGARFDLPRVVADSLLGRSRNAVDSGDPEAAERYLDAAESYLDGSEQLSRASQFDQYGSVFIPGFIALLRGDVDEAERIGATAIDDARRSRHPDWYLRGLVLLGLAHLGRGDAVTAHRFLIEALAEAERIGLMNHQRYVLGSIAATWATIDPHKGATLLSAVESINRRCHTTLPLPVIRSIEQATVELEESLAADELETARRRGTDMTLDDAVALALRDS
jgi:tetratricopeptide (TPR) repeat protein